MSSRKYEKNREIELKKKDRKLKEENKRLNQDLTIINNEYETLKKEYDLFLKNTKSLDQYKNRSSNWYSCRCEANINNMIKNIIVDSGCDLSGMSINNANNLNLNVIKFDKEKYSIIASGEKMRILGYVNTFITFQNLTIPIKFEILEGCGSILVGVDFMF